MKILVLGSGAREHAIVIALLAEPADGGERHEIVVAPGNAGLAADASTVDLDTNDPAAVTNFANENNIELVIIGPEAPLVAGVADALRSRAIPVFGPGRAAAALEGSKTFAKRIMDAAGVPTGRAARAVTADDVDAALDAFGAPYVVKADGLAAGKGVLVTPDRAAARSHAIQWLAHGDVLVEEFLSGQEVSLFFVSDGHTVLPLSPAQDFKRLLDGDEGPNTGGMGAYSPLPWLDDEFDDEESFVNEVLVSIALPTIRQLAHEGSPFIGLLYCGLILTPAGIRVIEFNARFGDPETQVVLARLTTPLSSLLLAAATGTLAGHPAPTFSADCAVTVVVASENYPDSPVTGREITGLHDAAALEGVHIAHAATAVAPDPEPTAQREATPGAGAAWEGEASSEPEAGAAREGEASSEPETVPSRATDAGARRQDARLIATGGRVLSVVATGADFTEARRRAYAAVDLITLEGSRHRTDIAARVDPAATSSAAPTGADNASSSATTDIFGTAAQPTDSSGTAAQPTDTSGTAAEPTDSSGTAAEPTDTSGTAAEPTGYLSGSVGNVSGPATIEGWQHVYSGKVRDLYVPAPGAGGATPATVGGRRGADTSTAGSASRRVESGERSGDGAPGRHAASTDVTRDVSAALAQARGVLVVASDRVSAFDYVLEPGIPGKGALLTALSRWWFTQMEGFANHVLENDRAVEGLDLPPVPAEVAERSMVVKSLEMFPIECVVRGYLSGSGWVEYQATQSVCGVRLPAGLNDGDKLPVPIYTPAFKAELGEHDENITYERTVELVGAEAAEQLRGLSLGIYARAAELAETRGIILADTKFEFGADRVTGEITLADEVLTSDSSRYWDAAAYDSGDRTASFDKQIVRNWLSANWDKTGTPPALPQEIVEQTAARYRELIDRLTGPQS
ncbi:phosphoribosylamine--glycine ligase [Subtercola sp. YIM 133946]|uniref:phosphoribosylamine--glycine ligase n=1 Tax=Subtercola sp. YIM 133946 TaxID=3118909 RepID=UPI002F9593F4